MLEEVAGSFDRAPLRVKTAEAFLDGLVAVDPSRRGAVEAQATSLRQGFLAAAEQRADDLWFEIPSRLNLLRRHWWFCPDGTLSVRARFPRRPRPPHP